MTLINAKFESALDTPMVAPGDLPTIRIRRADTQALVVTDQDTTEQGEGMFTFEFAPVVGIEYVVEIDGDPQVTGQAVKGGRFATGSFAADEIPNVKQAWTLGTTPNSLLRAVVSLEIQGLRVVLPGTATLSYTILDSSGAILRAQVIGVAPNASGYFSVTVDPFTPTPGTVIVAEAIITNGDDVYTSNTELSIPEF